MPEYDKFQCEQCGCDCVIVEYQNEKMDALTSLDVMSSRWVEEHRESVVQAECLRCDNILIYDQ